MTAGTIALTLFILTATVLILATMPRAASPARETPALPASGPGRGEHPYNRQPWGRAPRPDGPRPDTAPLPRLKLEAREADWRIEDLTRQFRLPPWADAPAGCSVFPAHWRGVA